MNRPSAFNHIEEMASAIVIAEAEHELGDKFTPGRMHQAHAEVYAKAAWAAGVGALIAHKPCGGTGWFCDGPHTVIDKGDGTKLYADKERGVIVGNSASDLYAFVKLPPEWRIE